MTSDTQISTLNTLIKTLIDSVNGFEDAASNTDNQRFQQLFREHSSDRRRIV